MAQKKGSANTFSREAGCFQGSENTGTIPRHRRPATMFSCERDQAKWALQAGRCVEDTAKEFHAQNHVISEIWLRDHERRLRDVERSLRGPAATQDVERKPIQSARTAIVEIRRAV